MDPTRFDRLSKSLAAGSRRSLLGVVVGAPLAGLLLTADAEARGQRGVRGETFHKRKVTYCLNGQTIRRLRRKQEKLLAMGATRGRCQPTPPATCTETCATGCCAGETCQPGTSVQACGTGGAACATCGAEETCRNQACGPICLPIEARCDPENQGDCCSGYCCGQGDNTFCCQPG